ncbi:exo70-like exocyst complex subunit [Laccaria bicolor S238N-H82]|uniref:Exocyst complex protein EXO70 n=1 Tax=Laccaria bicolor (strain S238N-H82 / ATCC MYA-4686) TaxID=486041 RepID=B0DVR7_LACBS|nr:exo70-like exocyst complex subunit [Laccaria bicolor S238N-H82]EDR01302.1 exo70-like exocyst complex subunit [Laccaria bicolor S238N-H82]|eukprot:XP_001888009.1 exo70-like exocyst complex subunit [Laccaria bicolor S238N-H82]
MDDETAEIELLQQNLNKTKQISKRMITILDSFDTRIAKLEKSILPLYTAAQILNRRRSNIDETLAKINDVAIHHEDLAAEEPSTGANRGLQGYFGTSECEYLLSRRDTATDKNELKDAIQTLRALCLRSFPEFLADIKLGATSRGSDTSTKLTGFTLSTVRYITKVPEVRSAVSSALLALGDGNWKMGEGIQVGQAREGDESAILEHFIGDVIITSLTSLTAISRTSRRPAFGSIFLLNNVSYLREHLLIQPTNPSISNLLPQSAVDALNSNFRTAKAGYFDSNFSPLMQALADDPRDKSSKGAAKEKFTRFFDLLDEVVERHRLAKVLEDEPAGRETLGEEVIRLVVPALQRFTQRQKDKDFSKNPQKYIKRSAEEVEQQLYALFH